MNEEAYQNKVARILLLEPTFDVGHRRKDRIRKAAEYFYQLIVALSQ